MSLDPRGFAGRFTWLLAATAAGALLELRSRSRDWYLLSLLGVSGTMALTSRRFIPLFALTALPILANLFTALRDGLRALLPPALAERLGAAGPIAALLLAAVLWRDVRLTPFMLERWTHTHLSPRAALRYLKALDPGPRLLNHYNWGGYVMLHAPEFKVLIDGRANTLYDDRTYLDYLALEGAGGGIAARFARYAVDAALVPSGTGKLAEKLTSPQFGWRVVYSDPLATVLLPPSSRRLARPLPRADEIDGDEANSLLARGTAAAQDGRTEEARSLIERAIELDPLLMRAYGLLAQVYAWEKNADGIAATIGRGIAFEPREASAFRLLEAMAYETLGDPERTLAALEQAVPRGPFSKADAILKEIAALRIRPAAR